MKNNIFLLIHISLYLIVSCNNGSKARGAHEALLQPNNIHEKVEVFDNSNNQQKYSKSNLNQNTTHENKSREGIINTDSDVFLKNGGISRILKGQNINILDGYYARDLSVTMEIETIDGKVTGYVSESNISFFDEPLHNFWFNNIVFIPEYFYTGTVEDIYNNYFDRNIGQDTSEIERRLRLWRAFYSEPRMNITNNFFVYGNSEFIVAYRLESINKFENNYIVNISRGPKNWDEYEINLVDDGEVIIITNYIIKSEDKTLNIFSDLINIRFVPYNLKKSENTRTTVFEWIDKQLTLIMEKHE